MNLYHVILRKLKKPNKDLAKILMAAGFAYLKSCQHANEAENRDQVIEVTHFERAEMIQYRITEQEKDINVDLKLIEGSPWHMDC